MGVRVGSSRWGKGWGWGLTRLDGGRGITLAVVGVLNSVLCCLNGSPGAFSGQFGAGGGLRGRPEGVDCSGNNKDGHVCVRANTQSHPCCLARI